MHTLFERFIEGGWTNWITLLIFMVGLPLSIAAIVIAAGKRRRTGFALGAATLFLASMMVTSGIVGRMLGQRMVEDALSSISITPSQRIAIQAMGYYEADSCITFGVWCAVLPFVLGLGAVLLSMRAPANIPTAPAAAFGPGYAGYAGVTEKPMGKAITAAVAALASLVWFGGFASWLDAPDEPVRQDPATMAVLDAAAAIDAASVGQDRDVEYACGDMLTQPMSSSAKAHPDFERAARGCVTYFMVSAKAAHAGNGVLPYLQGETLSPQGLLMRLEASDLMIDAAQRQELTALKKEISGPSGDDDG